MTLATPTQRLVRKDRHATTVYLLVPFSAREEGRPLGRPPLAALRTRARRCAEQFAIRLGQQPTLHYSTYEDRRNTNRGDMAIRLASTGLLRQAFGGDVQVEEVGWHELPHLDFGQVNARASLFVVAGGGYLNIAPDGDAAPRVVRDLALLQRLACPVVSLGPGLNRSLVHAGGEEARSQRERALSTFVDLMQICAVRDPPTWRMLDALRPGRIHCVADPALFLEPVPVEPAVPFEGWRIGLNLAFHDPIVSRRALPSVAILVELARILSAAKPCRFVYFVHSDAERLFPRLLRRAGVPVEVVDASPREMVARYGELDLHVCQMLHSSILAMNAGVPTLNLAYDVKNGGFFELMEAADFSVPAGTASSQDLAARCLGLLSQGDRIRARLVARKAALKAQMDDLLGRFVALCADDRSHLAGRAS